MKKVLAFIFALAFVLHIGSTCSPRSTSPVEPCLHNRFVQKHLCRDCRTDTDALRFSNERRVGHDQTGVNTVFFGNPEFHLAASGNCVNTDPVKAVKCNLETNSCKLLGKLCVGEHSPNNGHLFYKDIRC